MCHNARDLVKSTGMRAPLWLLVLLFLVIVGIGVYGYFTTPLPFGLSSVIRTPGGSNAATTTSSAGGPPGTRTAAGQTLILGSTNVVIQAVQRNQDLSNGGRGPTGLFTLLQVELQNGGSESLSPRASDFRLIDDRGRAYAVDADATRQANAAAKHRDPFEATVPPGGRLTTVLAFETVNDTNPLSLRVTLGYGDIELPR
jgi:Domain of unknown function (DUF4352)